MRHAGALTVVALTAMVSSPALAQEDRYRLERTENGYIRLDMQTGRMSRCTEQAQQLICRMATEDHAAYEKDITALEERIAALEARISSLQSSGIKTDLPTDEEFEQTLGYMERFFLRFMRIVTDLDRNFRDEKAPEESPDRT